MASVDAEQAGLPGLAGEFHCLGFGFVVFILLLFRETMKMKLRKIWINSTYSNNSSSSSDVLLKVSDSFTFTLCSRFIL